MATIIIIGALAVTLALVGYLGFLLVRRRQRNGAARLGNTLHLNAAWWHEHGRHAGDLLYVAIGDSAAQGVGASQPHHSYVGKIAAHLRHITNQSVRVINLSVSGARLREALDTQVPQLHTMKPDVLTVSIGANDILDFDRDRFDWELNALFDALPEQAIVADVPCFFFGEAERRVRVANTILRKSAEEHGLPVAPLYARTKRQSAAWMAINQVAADFFHPNDRGYRVWASAFIPLIDRSKAVVAHLG